MRAYGKVPEHRAKDRERCRRRLATAEGRATHAAWQRRSLYGISSREQWELLKSQDGRCAACREPLTTEGRQMHLDHDHVTGRVRGFLCRGCNHAVGQLKDSPLRCEQLAAYLRSFAPKLVLVKS